VFDELVGVVFLCSFLNRYFYFYTNIEVFYIILQASMEKVYYIVETDDDDEYTKYTESEMRECIDDLPHNVSTIIKKYRLTNKKDVVFRMTLFTQDYPEITAGDYVKHYCNMPTEIYGADIFSDLDRDIVERFNY
jgi:hypothetical protein